jgi:predicted PP-loop superfamily ATPase
MRLTLNFQRANNATENVATDDNLMKSVSPAKYDDNIVRVNLPHALCR